ncbi:MAG: MarR family winged helix-turn-helix transcriptional regulator [Bryobacteraceae bacterium]
MRLRGAYLSMHRRFEAHLLALGATADQYVLLTTLLEEDEIIQQELVRRLYSDPNTITGMLGRLEKRGLIRRETRNGDGRARRVFLSAKGSRLQRKLDEGAKHLHDLLRGSVKPDQMELVLKNLEAVALAMAPKETCTGQTRRRSASPKKRERKTT